MPSSVHERRVVNKLVNKARLLAREDDGVFESAFAGRLFEVVRQRAKGVCTPEEADRFANAVLSREDIDEDLRTRVATIFTDTATFMRLECLCRSRVDRV